MLRDKLVGHTIILASASPRRQQFFKDMGLHFEIRLKPIDEIHPSGLEGGEISNYLARLKASAFKETLKEKDILITSDTVVWHNGKSLAKPADKKEAVTMLRTLSNNWHEVTTSVCLTTFDSQKTISSTTMVKFRKLTDSEIIHYVDTFKPFDKAGAYGIQEWIGLIGIEEIKGSYTNIVGLPTELVYKTLVSMVD